VNLYPVLVPSVNLKYHPNAQWIFIKVKKGLQLRKLFKTRMNDYEYESIPLLMQNSDIQTSNTSRSSSIDRPKPKFNAYSSYTTTQKERTSTITNEDRKAQPQQNSACKNVLLVIEQYVSDLKLPFEIFIMTCMIVLMRGCLPILIKLLPKCHKES
jgi:hypothetical protein